MPDHATGALSGPQARAHPSATFWSDAFVGARAWAMYTIAEAVFFVVLSRLVHGGSLHRSTDVRFDALLFVLYPVVGGGVVAVVSAALRRILRAIAPQSPDPDAGRVATVTIVAVFVINLLAHFPPSRELTMVLLGLSAALIASVVIGPRSGQWAKWVGGFGAPWTASLLLLGSAWLVAVAARDRASLTKLALLVGWTATLAVMGRTLGNPPLTRLGGSRRGATLALVAAAVAIVVINPLIQRGPRLSEPRSLPLPKDAPNIVLITLDTVRADHLSLYGYARQTTPFLTRLAGESTVYLMAIAPADQTLSSHASLFTGLNVRTHGAFPTGPAARMLPGRFETLSERLAARGYATLAVVSNHGYLGRGWNLDQGFGYYDARPPVTFPGDPEPFLIRRAWRDVVLRMTGIEDWPLTYRRASEINDEVFSLLEETRRNARPFFLFVNYMDAHWPYLPPAPFADRFPGRLPNGLSPAAFDAMQHDVITLRRDVTEAERDHLVAGYDGAIAYLDFELNRLVDRLKQLGLYENTLLIVTSDHGEAFGDRQFLGHAMSVYQDQVYVPLLVKRPRSTAGARVEHPVSLIDVFPTVLQVAGADPSPAVQGRSLLAAPAPRTIVSESSPAAWHERFERTEYATFEGSLKLITSTQGKLELYDLAVDPQERRNLAPVRADVAHALQNNFASWLSTFPAATDATPDVDPEAVERLKALGYVR